MRIFGACAVALAGMLMGLRAVFALRTRVSEAEALRCMVSAMRLEILRFQTPLAELFRLLLPQFSGKAGMICADMARALEAGQSVKTAWCLATARLEPGAKQTLAELGDCLGRYGSRELEPVFCGTEEKLARLCEEARQSQREKGRVYMGLYTAGGLFLAILLL